MFERPLRVLFVCSHPVQYMSPLLRRLSQDPELEVKTVYCTLRGAQAAHDPDFNAKVQWDTPLLEGYEWVQVPNKGSGSESFFGLRNPSIRKRVQEGEYDAVVCHLSYMRASFWITYFACRSSKSAFLFGCDQNSLEPRDGRPWKKWVKRMGWPLLFGLADQVFATSSPAKSLIRSLGIPEARVTLTPLVVDNDWWLARSKRVNRNTTRAEWGATPSTAIVLFCAKLQPWKRPLDLLRAFAQANVPDSLLVFAGDGPLKASLQQEASALGISDRVRFIGFMNQTQLPAVYTSADLMVLPSSFEPFAVVVNESMLCACPAAASDQVGAGRDLILPVDPALIFPSGGVEALAKLLRTALADRAKLAELGQRARARMATWSPGEYTAAIVEAIRKAMAHKHGSGNELSAEKGRRLPTKVS
jgi:glycosyltransferase involved in cell wall biosynthesis